VNIAHDSNSDLQKRWLEGYCPIVNGIVHANGKIQRLDVLVSGRYPSLEVKTEIGESTSLSILEAAGHLEWTGCTPLRKASDPTSDLLVEAGECGMGADGFVAVSRLSTEALVWLAFFDCSNPFISIRIGKNMVLVKSTHGNTWKFDHQNATLVAAN